MPNPYAAPESTTEPEHVEPRHPVAGPPPPAPPLPENEAFVAVHTTSDLVEAEVLTQLLNSEGIPTPAFSRITGAEVGAGMIGEHIIRVPVSREAEARELVAAYMESNVDALTAEAGEADPIDHSGRSKLVRVVAVLLLAPMLLGLLFSIATALVHFVSGH